MLILASKEPLKNLIDLLSTLKSLVLYKTLEMFFYVLDLLMVLLGLKFESL